jgi:hypothetical protein
LLPPIMMEGVWLEGGSGFWRVASGEVSGEESMSHLNRLLSPSRRGL